MIVKDGAASLARCLSSVAGAVDRITVGDKGSLDRSREIAESFGAKIMDLPWSHDFGRVRNAVLAHAVCDWILVLDADEMLDDTAPAALAEMLRRPGIAAYQVVSHNYLAGFDFQSGGEQARANHGTLEQARCYPAYFRTTRLRLFRRDPRISFSHCVHESVADSLHAASLAVGQADFVIHHFGYVEDGREQRKTKDALYYQLAMKKLAEAPSSYEACMEAGIAELDYAKHAGAALEHFTRATQMQATGATGWLYRGICLIRLSRWEEALGDLARAAQMDPTHPVVHSAAADAYFQLERYADACAQYEQARGLGDASALSLAKLGAAEVRAGQSQTGLEKVLAAGEQCAGLQEVQSILMVSALLAGQLEVACQAAARCLGLGTPTAFNFLLAATIHRHAGDLVEVKAILKRGLSLYPDDQELQRAELS